MALKTLFLAATVATANALAIIPKNECASIEPHEGIKAIAAKVNAAKHDPAKASAMSAAVAASIDIPVYVHIVAADKTTSGGYLSSSTIQSAIDQMTGAYADTGFSFSLAGTDYTVDATASDDENASDSSRQALRKKLRKGDYKTLNLFVFPKIKNGSNGYCYFPTNVSSGSTAFYRDACTIRSATWSNKQTVPHETGHWLGLPHTFGSTCDEDGDGLDDTPRCTVTWSKDCGVVDTCPDWPGNDPVTNFMSYGSCRQLFTNDQIGLMKYSYDQYRA